MDRVDIVGDGQVVLPVDGLGLVRHLGRLDGGSGGGGSDGADGGDAAGEGRGGRGGEDGGMQRGDGDAAGSCRRNIERATKGSTKQFIRVDEDEVFKGRGESPGEGRIGFIPATRGKTATTTFTCPGNEIFFTIV